jgi:phosphatidylethanolamine-binding protein (PEBP) family uncharacterized protein
MEVYYNNKLVNNNEFIKPSETKAKPQIKYSFENNKLYTLLMYDPHSVYGNRFHWIAINIVNDIKNGNDLLSYTGPAPPPKTGTHHYIFELYEQDRSIDMKLEERNIPMDFVKKILNIVGQPISVVHFISKNQSGGKRKKRTKRKRTKGKRTKRYKRY